MRIVKQDLRLLGDVRLLHLVRRVAVVGAHAQHGGAAWQREHGTRSAAIDAFHFHGLRVVGAAETGAHQCLAHGVRHGAHRVGERVDIAGVNLRVKLVRQREAADVVLCLLVFRVRHGRVDIPAECTAFHATDEVGGLGAVVVHAVAHFRQAVFGDAAHGIGQLRRGQLRGEVLAEQWRSRGNGEIGRIRRDAGLDPRFGVGEVIEALPAGLAQLDGARAEQRVALRFRIDFNGRRRVEIAVAVAVEVHIARRALAAIGHCIRIGQVDAIDKRLVRFWIDHHIAVRIGTVVVDAGIGRCRTRGTVDELQRLAGLRIVEIDDAAFREAALRGFQRFLFVMAGRHEDAVAVFVDVAKALADRNGIAGAAFFFRTRVLGVDFQRRCAFFQDEVDHAGDGVGAIQGRGAVRQHFDAFDGRQGDRIEVDGGA